MLLDAYLFTTAINWIVVLIFSFVGDSRLKKKGYKGVRNEKNFSEWIAWFISTAFKLSIPVYNIINTIFLLCKYDEIFECVECRLLKEGRIYMPNEDEIIDEDEFLEETKIYCENLERENFEKQYSEMTLDEKLVFLKQEKEKLVTQNVEQSIEKTDVYSHEEQELVLKRTLEPKK